MRSEYTIALVFIIMLAGLVIKWINLNYQQATAEPVTFPQLNWVGVVDYNNDGKATKQSILQGEDVLLRVRPPEAPQHRAITHPAVLHHGDETKDHLITAHDPQYNRFQVLFIDPAAQSPPALVPIHQLGIYGIRLNTLTPHGRHEVVLGDGTTRLILSVPPEIQK